MDHHIFRKLGQYETTGPGCDRFFYRVSVCDGFSDNGKKGITGLHCRSNLFRRFGTILGSWFHNADGWLCADAVNFSCECLSDTETGLFGNDQNVFPGLDTGTGIYNL